MIIMVGIWVLTLLGLLSLGIAYRLRVNLKLLKQSRDRELAFYLGRSALKEAVAVLEEDIDRNVDFLGESWARGYKEDRALFKKIPLGGGYFTISYQRGGLEEKPGVIYGIEDESARVNINSASQDLLYYLFYQVFSSELSELQIRELAEAVIYWRGDLPQGFPPDYEDPYYENLPRPYPPRRAPFKSLGELSLVKGFREERKLMERIKPYLTEFKGAETKVNVNTASAEVIKALFLSEGVSEEIAETLTLAIINYRRGEDGKEATEDDRPIYSLGEVPVEEPELKSTLETLDKKLFTATSDLFRINITVEINTNFREHIEVILRRQPQFQVISWYED